MQRCADFRTLFTKLPVLLGPKHGGTSTLSGTIVLKTHGKHLALKNICLLPRGWTLAEYRRHSCTDGSHTHLSASQFRKHEAEKMIRVLVRASDPQSRTVAVRLATSYKVEVAPIVRGKSCYIGEPLALALAQRLTWAQVMLSEILRQRGNQTEAIPI